MTHDYTVADYLLDRLAQVGIGHLFGVPGDYNLRFLDHVLDHRAVTWVGNANELNAAYAADGYARMRGAGALLTTFGVGELSAINGLAGSFAEFVPVLQIVGAPASATIAARRVVHHTLGDGQFDQFMSMHAPVTVARAQLTADAACEEIDRVLTHMMRESRPGYLLLPSDVAEAPALPPSSPLDYAPGCDADQLVAFLQAAQDLLAHARSPALLVDMLAERFGAVDCLAQLVHRRALPYAATLLAKGLLDERNPFHAGTYVGSASENDTRATVEDADVLITAGLLLTDVSTAGFSHRFPERMIELQPMRAIVGGAVFDNIPMARAAQALALLPLGPAAATSAGRPGFLARANASTGPLQQDALWQHIEAFLQPGDAVVAEQGTSFFGMGLKRLPRDVAFIGQPLWGSIGYAIPAALGAELATSDRRVILLVGDGSAHLSAQEIGTMVRQNARPIIILVNNAGYTVERAIHGPQQAYNDIAAWDWLLLPRAMGDEGRSYCLRAESSKQLAAGLSAARHAEGMVLIEVVTGAQDVPDLLAAITRSVTGAGVQPRI